MAMQNRTTTTWAAWRNFIYGLFAVTALCALGEPVDYVNPFVGTAARGDTYPGPVWPLGMVQPGPDTGDRYWSCCQGYNFAHNTVMGFSQTHLSGTGCPDFQDVALLPFTGDVSAEVEAYKKWALVECKKAFANKKGVPRKAVIRGRMDKRTETAEPGYYAVTLTNWGVRAELTCSPRVAYHRYTFERGRDAHIYVNLQSGPQGWWKNPPPDRISEHRSAWDVENGLLSGYSCITAWAENRDFSFAVQFSPRPKSARRLEPLDGWKGDRWVLDFDLPDGGAVIAKAAVSSVDESGAKANLFADDGFDFDVRRAACRAAWNKFLSFAEIEAFEDKKAQFYTALYHAYVQPNMLSDVDGRYRDDARKVVKADGFTVYSTFSTWDTARAAHPLYTILTPSLAADFVNSMIDQQRASGKLSKWPLWGRETQCMVALHSVPVVVDAVLKGIPGIDAERAFAAVDASLADRGPVYDKCGYFPWDIHPRSVAVTLEWCLDDWCAARLAQKLGKSDRAAFYSRRADYWKNLFDPWTGYMRGKDAKGNWHEPFNPYRQRPAPGQVHDYVEGSAIQYTFHVMQDPEGLIAAFGGQKPFYRALDAFFTLPSKMPGQNTTGECTGTIGQYAHGNEPSHHVAYFFPYVGRGDRTAEIVREVCDKYYLNKPNGLVGNDDCGQMSAWFVFACLGFYSFNPCGGEYVVGAPQVPKTTLHLEGGKTFTVVANGLSTKNKYVKSVTLNGKPLDGFVIRHEDIMRGGELVFQMCGDKLQESQATTATLGSKR